MLHLTAPNHSYSKAASFNDSSVADPYRLSQMILDQVFHGVLNEKEGTLEIYDEPVEDPIYSTALDTLKTMQDVVKGLYEKATQVA